MPEPASPVGVGPRDVDFSKGDGLVPCIVQDHLTGTVLMLAYVDEEALRRTLETGQMHYHSRSRGELWRKGETSGHTQRLVSLHLDCDADTLVARVEQTGPACHTGEPTCFHHRLDPDEGGGGRIARPTLDALAEVLRDRRLDPPEGSWTARLYDDKDLRLEKVREEAEEVVAAARGEGDDDLAHELADLLYHALVAGEAAGVPVADVLRELDARRRG